MRLYHIFMGNQTGKQGITYGPMIGPDGTFFIEIPAESEKKDEETSTSKKKDEETTTPEKKDKEIPTLEKIDEKKDELPPLTDLPTRCALCQKKLGPSNQYRCRCEKVYCIKHMHSFNHSCTFDHKKFHREQLMKENPLLKHQSMKSQWNLS